MMSQFVYPLDIQWSEKEANIAIEKTKITPKVIADHLEGESDQRQGIAGRPKGESISTQR
jgi:hypothetical protein